MLRARDFLSDRVIHAAPVPASALPPAVSVILPTHARRAGGLLERAIGSVLAQSFGDFELLVMDDGSRDGSAALIETLRARDPRIVHVRHEHNCGLPALRVNEGIELARGRWIAFQFDDDSWRPNALADLVAAAERQPGPAVIVGQAHFTMKIGQVVLPEGKVDTLTLHERNRFANNSVLMARSLFDTYGMYDPHIGMRRLCDWDLWLRLVRRVPFVVLDQIVADVFEGVSGAIGLTVPYDIPLFRLFQSIPRDGLLTPARWREYEIDGLSIGGFQLRGDIGRRLYAEQILPHYLRFRHAVPGVEGFSSAPPPAQPRLLVYTKESYEIGNDILMTNFDAALTTRGSFKSAYVPLSEVRPDVVEQADVLLLMRTVEDDALRALDHALHVSGTPVGYCMDDDLLTFHEFGPQFAYLAPGTRYHRNLTEQISRADAVVVTSPFIAESARPLNPRIVLDNGAIPEDLLPHPFSLGGREARTDGRLKIGYVGTGYRIEEFEILWDALRRVAEEHRDRVEFEFWGLDVAALPPLAAPVVQRPFTFNYHAYLQALRGAGFDVLLTPLLDHPRPRLGKARIKYYETAVAGALGIFSDVPQYRTLPHGLTCLKAPNTPEEWYSAVSAALAMSPDEREVMRARCVEHVREEFTVEGQLHHHEAALRAVAFHGRTRAARHADGRPRVLYALHSPFLGGAELQLLRRAAEARKAGIEPVLLLPRACEGSAEIAVLRETIGGEPVAVEHASYSCFTEPRQPGESQREAEREGLRQVLERCRPAVVHSATFIPSLGQVAQELAIPHIASLYQVDEGAPPAPESAPRHCSLVHSDSLRYATRWSELLGGIPGACSRPVVLENLFELGLRRRLERIGKSAADSANGGDDGTFGPASAGGGSGFVPRLVLAGTFQPRKRQRETIAAVTKLARAGLCFELVLCGYTRFFPDYVASCRSAIDSAGLAGSVRIEDFTPEMERVLSRADILLTLSIDESLPGTIGDAMAAGVLVVATPVGGIPEVVIDGVSGILCTGTSVEDLAAGIHRALELPAHERRRIIDQARRVARSEFHPHRIANDLLGLYERAVAAGPAVVGLPDSDRRDSTASASARVAPRDWLRVSTPGDRTQIALGSPASTERVGAKLVYAYEPRCESWNGLDVLVGTHAERAEGRLELRVISPSGRVLREVAADLAAARDNDWLPVRFTPIRNAAERRFRLEFSLRGAAPETRISLYQTSPPPERPRAAARALARRFGFEVRGAGLYCRESFLDPPADASP